MRQAQASFESLDRTLLEAARTLGASRGAHASRASRSRSRAPACVAGGALALGRALGEFGATLMFAGSFRGVTQTAPLAHLRPLRDRLPGALALSVVLVAVSRAILLSVKLVGGSEVLGGASR